MTTEPDIRYEIDGSQIVQIGQYAYRWDGQEPLAVGDAVVVPGTWGPAFRGTVTGLGTRYSGHLASIVRRAD